MCMNASRNVVSRAQKEKSKILGIDIETYSSEELSKCGVYRYSGSPDFEILLFAWAFDAEEVQLVDMACGGKFRRRF